MKVRPIHVRFALAAVVCILLAGCAAKQTPQYNAAVVSNDFAHSMGLLQTEVISLHTQKLIPDDGYAKFKAAAKTANTAGLRADKLIATGDYQSALPILGAGLQVLQTIRAAELGIKDLQSQGVYTASLNVAIAALQATISSTQQKAAGGK